MARPVCTSLDQPPADVDGAVVRVRDQNWQQGLGNGEPLTEPRFVKSWSLDGGATWGIPGPGPQTRVDDPVYGQSPAGELTVYDFRGLIPPGESRDVLFEIAAGTHSRYVRQDGSVAYDVIEWGNQFLNGSPARFIVRVTNDSYPPAPTGPTALQTRSYIVDEVEDWEAGLTNDPPATARLEVIRRIAGDFATGSDTRWAKAANTIVVSLDSAGIPK
jgi:hypothetical protein